MNVKQDIDTQSWTALTHKGWRMIKSENKRPQRFKVLGERSSGTNLAEFMLDKNTSMSSVSKMTYGWKHGFPPMLAIARSDLILVTFRDPIAWARSMFVKPWSSHSSMHELSFSAFLRAEWHATVQKPARWYDLHPRYEYNGLPLQMDRHPISGQPFRNIFQMRNVKSAAWLGLANRQTNVVFVRMEALLTKPKEFLQELSEVFEIDVANTPELPTKQLGGGYPHLQASTREQQVKVISDADRTFILGELDISQERIIGYDFR